MALSGQTTCRRCGDLGKVGGGNPDAFVDLPPDEVIDVADIPLKELPEVLGGILRALHLRVKRRRTPAGPSWSGIRETNFYWVEDDHD